MIDLFLALLIANLGLVLDIGVESMSTLVIGGILHTQHVVKCGLPFMMLLHIFLQRSGLYLLCSLVFPTRLVATQVVVGVEASLL